MSAAKKIQQDRETANLQNHRERLVWLSSAKPCWSCGGPVDAHTKNTLLVQSREALRSA